jgi:hypothetical protein
MKFAAQLGNRIMPLIMSAKMLHDVLCPHLRGMPGEAGDRAVVPLTGERRIGTLLNDIHSVTEDMYAWLNPCIMTP